MCSSDGFQVWVLGVAPDLDPLVDKQVMDNKIDKTVDTNTNTNSKKNTGISKFPYQKCANREYGKKDKKSIVPFKKRIVVCAQMMVFMQVPEKSVHEVFMHTPGNAFHEYSGYQNCKK